MASSVPKGDQDGLTKRQAEFLAFVKEYVAECGLPPTYAEIASVLKISSKSGVHRIAHGLAARGHLRLRKNMERSMVVVEAPAGPDAHLISVTLPPKLKATLQALALRARIPADQIVSEALSSYIMEQPE
jgi:SOS-response transcriptional repressor LexA